MSFRNLYWKLAPPLLVFLASFSLFVFRIDQPGYAYFDEPMYVSAARQFLLRGINENWSHPPLGKFLIGQGIRFFGDNPVGWRVSSAIWGSLAVMAVFLWGLTLFRNHRDAFKVAALTLFNQLLFVQARLATLDAIMIGFLAIGVALVLPAMIDREGTRSRHVWLFGGCGVCFGIAMAVKWFAIVPIVGVLGYLILAGRSMPSFRRAGLPFVIGVVLPYAAAFGGLLAGMRHPAYAPSLGSNHYGFLNLIWLQLKMATAQMSVLIPEHPYQSRWTSWPWQGSFIWLANASWIDNGLSVKQAVIFAGNPLVTRVGCLAMGVCAYQAITRRFRDDGAVAAIIVGWFLLLWTCWSIFPRKTTFYYYYLPAALWLGPAIVFTTRRLPLVLQIPLYAGVVGIFYFFYPVLTFHSIPESDLIGRLALLPGH